MAQFLSLWPANFWSTAAGPTGNTAQACLSHLLLGPRRQQDDGGSRDAFGPPGGGFWSAHRSIPITKAEISSRPDHSRIAKDGVNFLWVTAGSHPVLSPRAV